MKIIAFCGHKQSGKSTAANEFIKSAVHPARLSFATPIKRALLAMGFTHKEIYEGDKERIIDAIGVSPRRLMQTLGTDWGRQMIHSDIWLILFERAMNLHNASNTDLVVIDDVRYDNEAAKIKQLGGVIIHVKNLYAPHRLSDTHSSERGIHTDFITHTLYNNGTLEEYIAQVHNLRKELLQ